MPSGGRKQGSEGEAFRVAEDPPLPDGLPDFSRLLWDDLYPRLLLGAEIEIVRMTEKGWPRGRLPGGGTAHDAVQAAVGKLRKGERRWDRSKSAFENLWAAVSGEIRDRGGASP